MDIQKEKEAFLNVYVNYKGDSRKIQFNEETEQFMWRKNNVSDTEVEYVHLMNQRWYAWLACAKSKAQAVPEGFVLVPKEPTEAMIQRGTKANSECLNENAPLGERLFRHPALQVYQAMVNGSGE
ncbi:hypothetical protein QUG64_05170 [Acinetobacter lwoffii]|jgi:hypothetical protein|uniref:Uncharacterized protein n=1 Tax=Acinetobacter lwoffii NCTC 5866 = CIP 64.10 = NIPH 512 TaxID=981327 RepID=A0ABP2ZII0_ACILW|nr:MULTISPECIES: hypothetical protein [Acinetobacter]ENU16236.1 hypothetical protein F995_01712 [Acinetobacter sp. CIP A162]ESJ95594.1 hypothetical protein P800_00408 [Acinetobacter lwoffii NCTC 5866 = CIP 64.10 = NIPH 512]QXB40856.1 hypothetical protein I6L23_02080 [Acinetobacter lwoffii]SUU31790.1 Uncharacterised protein [Acinetobacter lwoffii]VFQ37576.1 Uncharacterised protein [Acinetobacter lwoffii]